MFLDITIFLLTLFVLMESIYIVFITKKEIDQAFRFITGAIIVFALRTLFNFTSVHTPEQILKYFDLLFMVMLLLGLSYMVDCCEKRPASTTSHKDSSTQVKRVVKKIARKKATA